MMENYKPKQYFTPEPRWKDRDGTEYVGLVIDSLKMKVGQALYDPRHIWIDPRPSFQDYFLTLAFIISRRSLDPRTKHGCVFVKNSRILTTGYNSPPSGYDDSKVPLTSPEKYPYFIHSEINAIANAAKEGVSLEGATCYLTGLPCSECYRAMWAAGIKEIIHAPISLEYFGKDHIARVESATKPKLICLTKEQMKSVVQMLDDTFDYLETKIDFNTPDETPAS